MTANGKPSPEAVRQYEELLANAHQVREQIIIANGGVPPSDERFQRFASLVENSYLFRNDMVQQLLDPRRDIDAECGYPQSETGFGVGWINPELYRLLYEREAIANRVVEVFPKECWEVTPEVFEDVDGDKSKDDPTDFDEAWKEMSQALRGEKSWYKGDEGSPVIEHLKRADILSGIGHFGIMLLGLSDGGNLDSPVVGAVVFPGENPIYGGSEQSDPWFGPQDSGRKMSGVSAGEMPGSMFGPRPTTARQALKQRLATNEENIEAERLADLLYNAWTQEARDAAAEARKAQAKAHGEHAHDSKEELEHAAHTIHSAHEAHEIGEAFGGAHEAHEAVHEAHEAHEAIEAADHTEIAEHGTSLDAHAIIARHLYGPALRAAAKIVSKIPGGRKAAEAIEAAHEKAKAVSDLAVQKLQDRYGKATAATILGGSGLVAGHILHGVGKAIPGQKFLGAIPALALAEAGRKIGVVGPGTKLESGLAKVGAWVHAAKAAVGRGALKAAYGAGRATRVLKDELKREFSWNELAELYRELAANEADFTKAEEYLEAARVFEHGGIQGRAPRGSSLQQICSNSIPSALITKRPVYNKNTDKSKGPLGIPIIDRWEDADDITPEQAMGADKAAKAGAGAANAEAQGTPFPATDKAWPGDVAYSKIGTDAQYTGVQLGPSQFPADEPVKEENQLLFLRCFDESLVQVVQYEANVRNPRFGMPVMYRITLNDPREQHSGIGLPMATVRVHWTRVIHIVSDDLRSSEIFAAPRMRPVLNRLLDLRKLYSGSAEGYWRGGCVPFYSLETQPQLGGDVVIQGGMPALRDTMEQMMNGLQRWAQFTGMTLKAVAPQVQDPKSQVEVQIEAICIKLGIPVRVFKGSERGELASSQDDEAWNERVTERCNNYVTPKILIPFIDRLIAVGVLPEPKEGYRIRWPDREAISAKDKAQIAVQRTQALQSYVQGNVESLLTPKDYLVRILEMEEADVEEMLESTIDAHEEDSEDTFTMPPAHGDQGIAEPKPPPTITPFGGAGGKFGSQGMGAQGGDNTGQSGAGGGQFGSGGGSKGSAESADEGGEEPPEVE